jgi:prevent-host-death family protein
MAMVNMHEAKTHLSRLVDRVVQGEDVVIARAGRPVARLVVYDEADEPRTPGALKGQIWIADDFDVLPPEVLAAFGGEPD